MKQNKSLHRVPSVSLLNSKRLGCIRISLQPQHFPPRSGLLNLAVGFQPTVGEAVPPRRVSDA